MKKLFIIAIVLCTSFGASAQFGHAATFPLILGDTLTNVDTVSKVITMTAGYNEVGIQISANKVSGTLTGKVYLQGSMLGVDYITTDSTAWAAYVATSYSVNANTNYVYFTKVNAPFVYWRVLAQSSSGTVSAPVTVSYTLRKNISQ